MRILRFLIGIVAAVIALYALNRSRRPTPDRAIVSIPAQKADSVPGCGSKIITDQGVGEVRIGVNIDSLKRRCRVVGDTTKQGLEGMMERRAIVAFPPDMLEAEIVDGKVWRIDITSPAFRTADSLGVGSPLADLLRHHAPVPMAGEGIVVVMVRDFCGVSFAISGGFHGGTFRKWTKDELLRLPVSTQIEKILVFGCGQKGGAQ